MTVWQSGKCINWVCLVLSGALLLFSCQTPSTDVRQLSFNTGAGIQLPLSSSALLLMPPSDRKRVKSLTLQNLMSTQKEMREGESIMKAGRKVLERIYSNVQADAVSRPPDVVFLLSGETVIDTFWLTYSVTAKATVMYPDGRRIGTILGRSTISGHTAGSERLLEDAYVKAYAAALQKMLDDPGFAAVLQSRQDHKVAFSHRKLQSALGFPVDAPMMKTLAQNRLKDRMAREMKLVNAAYQVSAAVAIIRDLPDPKADPLSQVPQGQHIHIIGALPDGWLRVASQGKPAGWVHKAALDMEQVPDRLNYPSEPVPVRFEPGLPRPDDIAVIIGNADYSKGGRDIPAVVPAYADAEGFKQYARTALGIREGNIIHIRDATQADLISVFGSQTDHRARLHNWVRPGLSRVYIYYAGHGAPGGDGNAYLVPSDADPSTLHLNGYRLDDLYRNLSLMRAESVTVVLEACFSGSSVGGALIANASPVYLQVKGAAVPKGVTVIAAGAANQMASWEQDQQHSLFTSYFLKGMAGEADKAPHGDGNGEVEYAELDRYLRYTVTYYARRYYGRDQNAQIVEAGGQ